jgi:hypothetical protein
VAISSLVAGSGASPILLEPPSAAASTTALLVWVPGGKVPNTYYEPVMKALQAELEGRINLWVSIAECTLDLCIPVVSSLSVASAVNQGKSASGVGPELTWMGGHSLGSVEADHYCRHNAGKDIGGGCVLMGGYAATDTGGPSIENMLNYPVPVLSLIGELDFGSARLTKMAPYYQWAETTGQGQLARTPVVLVPDVDHSDMCEGFPVGGDLPSATDAGSAVKALAEPTAAFMVEQILKDAEAASSMDGYLKSTKAVMDPINEALALERGPWCEELQREVAGPLASKIGSLTSSFGSLDAPSAQLSASGKTVDIVVTSKASYEGSWPVGPDSSVSLGASAQAGPAVGRNTASSLGCRVVSRKALAALLKTEAEDELNVCKRLNVNALAWATEHLPKHNVDRYESDEPCNGCAKAVPVSFVDDTAASGDIAKEALDYELGNDKLMVGSPSRVTDEEYSCMLLSTARAVDIVLFDAFSASRYSDSESAVMV